MLDIKLSPRAQTIEDAEREACRARLMAKALENSARARDEVTREKDRKVDAFLDRQDKKLQPVATTARKPVRERKTITHKGTTLTIADWAERIGVHENTISGRLAKGWSIESVLTKSDGRKSRGRNG